MLGFTSVTFRQLPFRQILRLGVAARIGGIEWGGDVHLPPGSGEAEEIALSTAQAGLRVLSYGSYYRLLAGEEFSPILDTARRLGAPNIRIWAGSVPPEKADEALRKRAAEELRRICAQSGEMQISLEYHRDTLTQTAESTTALLEAADCPNLRTYWQPNPDLSHEENCRELSMLLPWLSNVHVFQWSKGNLRHPLAEGAQDWKDYLALIADHTRLSGREHHLILEFVKEDSETQFMEDTAVLREWL